MHDLTSKIMKTQVCTTYAQRQHPLVLHLEALVLHDSRAGTGQTLLLHSQTWYSLFCGNDAHYHVAFAS